MKALKRRSIVAVATLLLACLPAQAVLVDVDLGAGPEAVTLVSGGGTSFGWLNLSNEPLTLEQALTGSDFIGGGGFGNAEQGTIIDLHFPTGVVANRDGHDLALFEGFNADPYFISTDFDGFTAEKLVGVEDFTTTGESGEYYYEQNSGGPFLSELFEARIDLSDLDVPSGASVSIVRLRTFGRDNDPFGLATIIPEASSTLYLWLSLFFTLRRRRSRS